MRPERRGGLGYVSTRFDSFDLLYTLTSRTPVDMDSWGQFSTVWENMKHIPRPPCAHEEAPGFSALREWCEQVLGRRARGGLSPV